MEGRWAGGLVGQSETAVDFSGWAPSSFPAAYLSTASCYTYYTKRHTKTKTKRHTHKDKDKDCTSIQGQLLHTATTFLGFAYLCHPLHWCYRFGLKQRPKCPLPTDRCAGTGTLHWHTGTGTGTGHKCHSALHFLWHYLSTFGLYFLTPWRLPIGEAC